MEGAWIALVLSLKVAVCATALNALLGVALAYVLARRAFWGREVIEAICTLPMVLPPTVLGYYLLVLVGRKTWLGKQLASVGIELIFTWQGAVLAAALVSFPLVFRAARAAFDMVDAELEDAARVAGLNAWAVFWRVSLPLAWRAILAGLLLAFARALGEFGATLMVAGSIPGQTQTLSLAVYEAVQAGQDELAQKLVWLTSAVCVLTLLLASYLLPGYAANKRES